jgi:hypothetical protein
VADDPTEQAGTQGPGADELLTALDKVAVTDVLVQALAASVSIGFRRVSAEARDLPQARLAIESVRALEPVLREHGVDDTLVRDLERDDRSARAERVAAAPYGAPPALVIDNRPRRASSALTL